MVMSSLKDLGGETACGEGPGIIGIADIFILPVRCHTARIQPSNIRQSHNENSASIPKACWSPTKCKFGF